jgi:hypothetical protein
MNQRPVLGVKLPEFELMRELTLHGNRLSALDHKRVYRGLYRWNCSHEAFFPHACKDGEALWRPPAEVAKPAKSGSARRLLQFAWADLTEFEALRAYEEQRQLALRSGDGGGGDCAVCAGCATCAACAACAATCAAACAALLTCVALVLALACARRAARRAAQQLQGPQLQGPQAVKLEVSCVL